MAVPSRGQKRDKKNGARLTIIGNELAIGSFHVGREMEMSAMMRPLILLAGAAALISAAPVPTSSSHQLYLLSYDLFDGDS